MLKSDDRRRLYGLGNRLWHTDASFQDPPGRYSMLSARIIPPVDADTEFADTRAAYDALPASMKAKIEGLRVHHSIAHSRRTLGFEFSKEEEAHLLGGQDLTLDQYLDHHPITGFLIAKGDSILNGSPGAGGVRIWGGCVTGTGPK